MSFNFKQRNFITWSPNPGPNTLAPSIPVSLEAEDITDSLADDLTRQYPMRTHADIKQIVVHHTATAPNITVQRIAEFQVNNKDLPGIIYHFCITAEGVAYQTQYLETIAPHAGPDHSRTSVGVCLIGNFMTTPPPKEQMQTTAPLLAQIALMLGLSADNIVGYNEISTTGSPGATWPTWKKKLLTSVRRYMRSGKPIKVPKRKVPAVAGGKPIEHYMLFWHNSSDDWAELDIEGSMSYIARFTPTIGFDVEEAKTAKYVTIVGDVARIPASVEQVLRAAGCKVERVDGQTEVGTRLILQQMAAQGRRFKSFA